MKKSIVITLVLTLFLSLLMGITAFADKFQVVKTIADISKFTKVTDQNDPKGYIHIFNPDYTSKAELATVDGKKLVKITANGGDNNYFHSRLGLAADPDISTGKPDGVRFYVKTEDTSFAITIRIDYAKDKSKSLFLFNNIYIVDKDGKRVEFEPLKECQVVLPANFEGYIVLPFDKEYTLVEGEADPTNLILNSVYQFMIAMDPVDSDTFDGDIFYLGNMETVKIQKIIETAAPTTPAKTTAAQATTTSAPNASESAVVTATAQTTTEAITTTAAGTTVTTAATTSAAPVDNKTSNGWILPVIIALVVIGAGVTAFIMIKKRKNA